MRDVFLACKLYLSLSWKTIYKHIVMVFILLTLLLVFTLPYLRELNNTGYPINIFETYIVSFTSLHTSLYLSVIMLFSISCNLYNEKKVDKQAILSSFIVKWLFGKWLYILIISVVFCTLFLIVNIIISIPFSFIENEWSIAAKIIATGKLSSDYKVLLTLIPENIIVSETPYYSAAYIYLLQLLQLLQYIFLANFALNVQLINKKVLLPVFVVLANAVNWMMRAYEPGSNEYRVFTWLSPLYHGTYIDHQYITSNSIGASLLMSIVILSCLNIVLIITSFIIVKTRNKIL